MTPSTRFQGIARNRAVAFEYVPDGPNPVENFLNALNAGLNEIKRCLVGVPHAICSEIAGTVLLTAFTAASSLPAEPFRDDPPPALADWYECLGRNRDGSGMGGTGLRNEACLLLVVARAREGRYGGCAEIHPEPASRSAPDRNQERKSNEQEH